MIRRFGNSAMILTILAVAMLLLGSACASLSTPNNATTQALGEISSGAALAAPVVAATVPMPWGTIAAGAIGLVGAIAGMVVTISAHKVNTQGAINAVAAGAAAAGTSISQASPASTSAAAAQQAINAADAAVTAANQTIAQA